MRLIIAGSRTATKQQVIDAFVAAAEQGEIVVHKIKEIVSGGARGADTHGEFIAQELGVKVQSFIPEWDNDKYRNKNTGKSFAGLIRNQDMAKYGDQLIAVWDGESKGTKHMINEMQSLGKPVFIWYTEDQ